MISHIVRAHIGHAITMAPMVREAEVREIMDSDGLTPLEALSREIERSISSWTWLVDGVPACMFGVVLPDLMCQISYPWFLSTDLVEIHRFAFARACKRHLPELMELHPHLVGKVDARYDLSVRWLKWMGAIVGDPEPWGVSGAPFMNFSIGG